MGILRRLFGSSPAKQAPVVIEVPALPDAPNRSAYPYDVVGEASFQREIGRICGGKTERGHRLECFAELRPEPHNPHDKGAIAVHIHGQKVGYLSRAHAARWSKHLAEIGSPGATASVKAKIVGGWRRSEGRSTDEGDFGVKLRL